jgi:hypothetical protein
MREFIARTKRVGDLLVVALPVDLVQSEHLEADTLVKITLQKCQKPSNSEEKNCSLGPEDPWKLLE